MKARQDDPGRADGVQIAGAQQPSLAGRIKDALGVGLGEHGRRMFHYFVESNVRTENRNTRQWPGTDIPDPTFAQADCVGVLSLPLRIDAPTVGGNTDAGVDDSYYDLDEADA